MRLFHFFQISASFFLISLVSCVNIGFFCNTGAYSHDAYFIYLAENAILYGHNSSIIQISIFKFNRKVQFEEKFRHYISHDFTNDSEARKAQATSEQLMWEIIVPYDFDNGSFIGIRAAMKIQESYMRGCASALDNQTFISQIRNLNLDLMVIDYVMNDCAIGIANYLNVPTVYASNLPLYSNYLDYIGIPSNPSYVATFLSNFDPCDNFPDKLLNLFGYTNLVGFRWIWYNRAYRLFYQKLGVELSNLSTLERRTLMFGTPWEMFLDMPRPMARNLRYFGCENCHGTIERRNSNFTDNTSAVVLVSFGTLVNVEEIPVKILQTFVKAFTHFPRHTFLWQLDTSLDYFQNSVLNPIGMKMPENVRLYRWLPMKQLLDDPKVLLVITHGGTATCLEISYSGIPVLGIAIHSDQFHNTHSLEQKGLGKASTVVSIDSDMIIGDLNDIFQNYRKYKSRALKFRDMLMDYRRLEKSPSGFWIDFVARHFSDGSDESRKKLGKYWSLRYPSNWLIYHDCDILLITVIMGCLVQMLIL